jgi:hypothetical protein
MNLYQVTIRAIVVKTITLCADTQELANDGAHELFDLAPDNSEHYEQDTLKIEII